MSIQYNKWVTMPRFSLQKNAGSSILNNLNLKDKECLEIDFWADEILKLLALNSDKITRFNFSEYAINVSGLPDAALNKKNECVVKANASEISKGTYLFVKNNNKKFLDQIINFVTTFMSWLSLFKEVYKNMDLK